MCICLYSEEKLEKQGLDRPKRTSSWRDRKKKHLKLKGSYYIFTDVVTEMALMAYSKWWHQLSIVKVTWFCLMTHMQIIESEVELLWVLLPLPLASLCVISCLGDGALCSTQREDNLTQMVGLSIPVSADCTEGPFVPHNLLHHSSKHGYEKFEES